MEKYLTEVGTPPPHNLVTLNELVDRKTTTTTPSKQPRYLGFPHFYVPGDNNLRLGIATTAGYTSSTKEK